ncbi:MAG: methyl-accepting chemotaxis protein [Aeromonas salmonicida]
MKIENVMNMNAGELNHADDEAVTFQSGAVSAWIGKFSFNGKMRILLLCITILTLAGNWLTADLVHNEIRIAIETGLINQVQAEAHRLEEYYHREKPTAFIAQARASLEKARWGDKNSGYFFLTDSQANLLVYPPDHQRLGKKLDEVLLQDSNESVNQALIRIARSGQPSLITYPYIKPASQERMLKTAYVYPFGEYLLVAGVYLDSADEVYYNYLQHSSIILAGSLIVLLIIVTLFSFTFSSHVKVVLKGLQDIANKKLTTRMTSSGKDEIAFIIQAMEVTRQQLAEILYCQRDRADDLTVASAQISNGLGEVNGAISEQRQRLDNLASAMEQMIASIREVTQNAQLSADGAKQTDQLASGGAGKINDAIVAINHLFNNLNDSSNSVNDVEHKVDIIGSIIDTINGISEQTNLLALNAAIEAARAGEQGRGFSVVADEVRTLAKRTKAATYEISEMIIGLQQCTKSTVILMQESIRSAAQAKQDATVATEYFDAIVSKTGELSQHCQMIAAAVEEQTVVTGEATRSLQVIRDVVQDTELVSKDLNGTGHYMQQTAEQMNEIVKSYRLS